MRLFVKLIVIALVLSAICDQSEAFKKKKKFLIFKGGKSVHCQDSARPCQSEQLVQQQVHSPRVVEPLVTEQEASVRAVAPVAAVPVVAAIPAVAKVKVPKKVVKKAAKKLKKKAPKIKRLLKGLGLLGKLGGAGGKQQEDCDQQTSQPRVVERQVQHAEPAYRPVSQQVEKAAQRPFGMPTEQKTLH